MKGSIKFLWVSGLLIVLAAGCAPQIGTPALTSGSEAAAGATWAETKTATMEASASPEAFAPEAPIPVGPAVENTPTDAAATGDDQPTVTLPAADANPLFGLALVNSEGIWRYNPAGELEFLASGRQGSISPDGRYLLFTVDDPQTFVSDIWWMDLETKEARNLTQTPDRYEQNPSWWPGRQDRVIFTSDTEMGMESSDHPTMINLDGSGYTLLDDTNGGPYAVSPDGEEVFYGGYNGKAFIYREGGETGEFDPASYGIPAERLSVYAWAPNGRKLATLLGGTPAGSSQNRLGVGIFDLDAGTGELFHVYTPQGGGEASFDLVWGPDGRRLAFTTYWEDPSAGRAPNLWVIQSDGSLEQDLGPGFDPLWSPDGKLLAFLAPNPETGFGDLRLVELNSWTVQPVDVGLTRPGYSLMDWIRP